MTGRARSERKRSGALELAKQRTGAGVSRARVASEVGVSEALVRRWEDDEDDARIALCDVPALPREMAIGLLEWAADQLGYDVSPRLAGGSIEDHIECIGRCAETAGEAVAHLMRSSIDGVLDRQELRRAKPMTQRLRRDVVALDNMVDEGLRRNGMPVLRKVEGGA